MRKGGLLVLLMAVSVLSSLAVTPTIATVIDPWGVQFCKSLWESTDGRTLGDELWNPDVTPSPISIPMFTKVTFIIAIYIMVPSGQSLTDVFVKDIISAEWEVLDAWATTGSAPTWDPVGKGKMSATLVTWDAGDLPPGEYNLFIKISTRLNPAGKQEFTSPGTYLINSGATMKYFVDGVIGKQSMTTEQIPIIVT